MRLILVRGVPGTGKSTYAKTLNILHLESDMFCITDGEYHWEASLAKQRADLVLNFTRLALISNIDCVVTNTFTRLWEMQPFLNVAKIFGATVEVHTMTKQHGSVHNVPEDTINKMIERWEEYPGEIKH